MNNPEGLSKKPAQTAQVDTYKPTPGLSPEEQEKEKKDTMAEFKDRRESYQAEIERRIESMGVKSYSQTTKATVELAATKMAAVYDKLDMSEEEKDDMAAQIMKDFIDRIAGEDSEIDHAELLKVHMYGKQLGDMLASDDPKMKPLQDAVVWALGKSPDGRDLESKRAEVTETLKEALATAGPRRDVAAMTLALMSPADQTDILKKVNNPAIAQKLVSQGYTTPMVLKDAGYDFGPEVQEAYTKHQKAIEGAVRGMKTISIGAENYANQKITLKNGLRGLGYAMGATGVLLNVMASWKHPSSLLTNEHFWLANAEIGAAYYSGSDRKLSNDLKPKGDRDLEKADKNERIILDELNRSATGWAEFFEFQDGEALSALWEFMGTIRDDKEKLPASKLTIANFQEFLKTKPEYADVLAAFKDLSKESGTMTGRSFVQLACAFDTLTIGGTALDAKLRYAQILKEAKERKA
ncbi:MAG: hypothetical protein WC873_04350 [Candidatus Gracilibacteria bacterium]